MRSLQNKRENMRTFIALNISEDIRKRLAEFTENIQNGLVRTGASIKYVEPENLHLTIKFLGDTPENLIPQIHSELERFYSTQEKILVKIGEIGVFPNRKFPKVVWVGINGSREKLQYLQKETENICERFGYKPEGRDFSPHLTLARVKSIKSSQAIMSVLDSHRNYGFGKMNFERITFYQSILQSAGPIYKSLYQYILK